MWRVIFLVVTTLLFGCTAPVPYAWQDMRQPARETAATDLEECRAFAARQYRPGMPAGEPFLKDQPNVADIPAENNRGGEWRPDRSPWPTTNVNAQPVHDIPVEYTGFPGELDYSPDYLDDILEKCMHDRGWSYDALPENQVIEAEGSKAKLD
jgi:hypothetical protein